MQTDLVKVCRVFNEYGVNYLIIGAHAAALHGHVRATEDIDILVEDEDENLNKVIQCIRKLYPHIEDEISITDFRENVVLKIADYPELDISIRAWNLGFDHCQQNHLQTIINGTKVPFLSLPDLIEQEYSTRNRPMGCKSTY